MSWLSGYDYRVKLTINSSLIDSDLSNWTLVFDQDFDSVLTSVNGPLDADGTQPMLSNGGDIRMTSQDGISRIPVDLRQASTDNDPSLGKLEVACRMPSVSSSANTDLYLYWGKAGDSQPTPSDINGQYNAYDSNYEGIWPLTEDPGPGGAGDIEDRTSNQDHGTAEASMTSADLVDGKVGNAYDFDGSDDYIDCGDITSMDGATEITLSCCVKFDTRGDNEALIRKWTAGGAAFTLHLGSSSNQGNDDVRFGVADSSTNYFVLDTTANILSNGVWMHLAGVWDGFNNGSIYKDGTSQTTNTALSETPTSIANVSERLSLAARYNGGSVDRHVDAQMDEIRISSINRSAAWIKADYNNLLNPSIFLSWGTIETEPSDFTLTADSGSYLYTGTAATLVQDFVIIVDAGNYTKTGTTITLQHNKNIPIDAGSYTTTGTNVGLQYGRNLIIGSGSYTYTGSNIDLLKGRTLTVDAGSYTITGAAAGLKLDFNIVIESGLYTYSGDPAELQVDYTIVIGAGNYTIIGTDVILRVGFSIAIDAGLYTINGTVATLQHDKIISADTGSYVYTGTDLDLLKGFTLTVDAGTYTISGTDITIQHDKTIPIESGSYVYTGSDSILARKFTLTATAGSYTYAGTNAFFLRTYVINVDAGNYVLSGKNVSLVYSAEPPSVENAITTTLHSMRSSVPQGDI